MKAHIGLVSAYAPLEVGWKEAPKLLREAKQRFSKLGVKVTAVNKPVFDLATGAKAADLFRKADVDVIVWVAATWSFDHVPVDVASRVGVPLVAWGVPGVETGSLCGSQQLVSVLTEMKHPRRFVFGRLSEKRAQDDMMEFVRAAAALKRLRETRLGMLGHRTIGMTEVAFHEYDVKEVFGPIVVCLATEELTEMRGRVTDKTGQQLWSKMKGRAGKCRVKDEEGVRSMKCYAALRKWIRDNLLGGVAVGCYPRLMGEVCLACGMLAEEDIVTACEGDMNSLIMTYLMHHISSSPVHNTDLLDVDHKKKTTVLSHCGNSAISLAASKKDVTLDSVRLMGQGVVSTYTAKPGVVTFANLCGKMDSYRMTFGAGKAVPTGMVFPGIPVRMQLSCEVDEFLERTADFGTGHHWMICYGDIRRELRHVCQLANLMSLEL